MLWWIMGLIEENTGEEQPDSALQPLENLERRRDPNQPAAREDVREEDENNKPRNLKRRRSTAVERGQCIHDNDIAGWKEGYYTKKAKGDEPRIAADEFEDLNGMDLDRDMENG
jgi:hypothetical protein